MLITIKISNNTNGGYTKNNQQLIYKKLNLCFS